MLQVQRLKGVTVKAAPLGHMAIWSSAQTSVHHTLCFVGKGLYIDLHRAPVWNSSQITFQIRLSSFIAPVGHDWYSLLPFLIVLNSSHSQLEYPQVFIIYMVVWSKPSVTAYICIIKIGIGRTSGVPMYSLLFCPSGSWSWEVQNVQVAAVVYNSVVFNSFKISVCFLARAHCMLGPETTVWNLSCGDRK